MFFVYADIYLEKAMGDFGKSHIDVVQIICDGDFDCFYMDPKVSCGPHVEAICCVKGECTCCSKHLCPCRR